MRVVVTGDLAKIQKGLEPFGSSERRDAFGDIATAPPSR
jgi:hypothetical protein